jgi:hypothetical protein
MYGRYNGNGSVGDVGPSGADYAWDVTDSQGNEDIGQIIVTGGTDPSIDVMTHASGVGYSQGNAWMDVGVTVTTSSAVNGYVQSSVPIILKGAYSLSGSGSSYGGGAAVESLGQNNGWTTPFTMWSLQVYNSSRDGTIAIPLSLSVGEAYYFQYQCSGGAGGAGECESQCVLDPIIEIDPTATVLYNGQQVLATSLYQISYSQGVDPPTVPDGASTLFLSALSLAAIWSFGRVKAVRRLG